MTPHPGVRRMLALAGVVAALVYGAMVWLADGPQVAAAMARLPVGMWVGVAGLSCLSYGMRFLRWQLLLAELGHRLPWRRSLAIYLAGFALTLTPGKAGETVRSLYLRPMGVPFADSLAAFVVERLFDLLAVGAMASLAALAFQGDGLWTWGVFLACVALALLLRAQGLPWLATRLAGRRFAAGVACATALLRGSVALRALPLSLLAWAAQGLALAWTVEALAPGPGIWLSIGLYCLALLAGAVSFIPGGLGVTEVALALLLGLAGLERADAVTAALVTRGLTLWLAVLIGVVSMARLALRPQSDPRP
jgi:glycosyltransferase 2 family protein